MCLHHLRRSERAAKLAFRLAMQCVPDEMATHKHVQMHFVEFLEALGRVAFVRPACDGELSLEEQDLALEQEAEGREDEVLRHMRAGGKNAVCMVGVGRPLAKQPSLAEKLAGMLSWLLRC